MRFRISPLRAAVLAALSLGATAGQAQEATIEQQTIEVSGTSLDTEQSGAYRLPLSDTATGLSLTPRETSQAMSFVSRQQMDDFSLDSLNDVLQDTPGVTVEKVETDRTYYTARGFDITNFQVDGLGVPAVYGNLQGDLDTALYHRVVVLRGANGLMSGTGNPSATVNLVRKRPTQEFQASAAATVGSWDQRRVEGDISGALNEAGTVRGRLVGALDEGESYLDRYEYERDVIYGALEVDLTDTTLLTLGHSRNQNDADSPLWGALPLAYSDGTATDYDVSTSTASDWSYWNNTTDNTFVELTTQLPNYWAATARLTRLDSESDGKLFYLYGSPDAGTGLGLKVYPSLYNLETEHTIADVYARGPFTLGGREHELILGAQWYESEVEDISHYGQGIDDPLGVPLEDFDGDYPEPTFDARIDGSDWTHEQYSAYGATRLTVTDQLTLIGGLRVISLDSEGVSYGAAKNAEYNDKVTPYAGIVYDLNPTYSVYASYTEIFNPQTEVDINRDPLAPAEGSNYEAGIKADLFGGKAYGAVAVFRSEQDDVAEWVGYIPGTFDSYHQGVDMTSKGFEIDLAGELLPGWQANAGYTYLDIEDAEGERTKRYVPRHQLKLATTYRLAAMPALKVGGSLRWQDDIENASRTVEQESYALVDLMASYALTDQVTATLNVNNVTDEKYLNSLLWAQGFYGAPRNASLQLSWAY